MILHADGVNPRAFEHGAFDLHVIGAAVVEKILFLPDPAVGFIDSETVCRKIFFCRLEAPLHKIRLVVERTTETGPPPESFVGHFPEIDPVFVAIRQFRKTLFQRQLDSGDIFRRPFRRKDGVVQTVRLRFDPVCFAEIQTQIRSGSAVNFRAVCGEPGLALLRLQIAPVKGQRGNVAAFGKIFPVQLILLSGVELIQHEQVCPVTERVIFLDQFHFRAGKCLAFCIGQRHMGNAFAIGLDPVFDPVFHVGALGID